MSDEYRPQPGDREVEIRLKGIITAVEQERFAREGTIATLHFERLRLEGITLKRGPVAGGQRWPGGMS